MADDGEGIPEADRCRLFEPFFSTRAQGLGLGLVACRAVAEAHGGSVEVEARPGRGSRFTLRLPLVVSSPFDRMGETVPEPERVAVLILEDDAAFADVLQEELRARGHAVELTATVAEACKRLKEDAYDVALLDLQLPDGSGLDVLREIAAEGLTVEALVLTGHAEVPTALEAMKLGAYDYLSKPPRLEELTCSWRRPPRRPGCAARTRRCGAAAAARAVQGFVTEDSAMKQMLATLERAAPSELPVLIQGETGTGKELLARALHDAAPRGGPRSCPSTAARCPRA